MVPFAPALQSLQLLAQDHRRWWWWQWWWSSCLRHFLSPDRGKETNGPCSPTGVPKSPLATIRRWRGSTSKSDIPAYGPAITKEQAVC
jgi:hypothetical protein